MSGPISVRLRVNGVDHELVVEPRLLLVHALRDRLGLTGTHVGCDTSNCGACTVHLDDRAVKSCTVLAVQADGAEVTTIEGLAPDGSLHPLQEAFWNDHALQCGYCTPGMIMAAAALLEENPNPSEDEVRHALEGNLCRCTGYHNIVKAVLDAAKGRRAHRSRPRRAEAPLRPRDSTGRRDGTGGEGMSSGNGSRAHGGHVGRAMRRKEDPRMITGRARYIDDISVPGMLYATIVRSPEAHATITSIDTSAAAARPDVAAVFTGEELAEDFKSGMAMVWAPPGVEMRTPDNWPLKRGEVKHVGDPVAVVVGRDRYSVVDAAEQVVVEYEPKPVVTDPERALEEGSPLVWEQFGTNRTHEWKVSGGDIDAALAEAEVVVEQRFVNHRTAGAAIEMRGALADPHGDSVTLYSSTQVPHIARFVLSGILGIPEDKLRVIAPDVGGGFGSKLQVYPEEALVVALARRLNQPVKWIETRSENMTNAHHGRDQVNYVTLAAKRDGTVTGVRVRIIADLGAYQLLLTPFIPELGFPVMGGTYKFPAIDLTFEGVFTNKMCTDAIRGAGRPEGTYLDRVDDEQARG